MNAVQTLYYVVNVRGCLLCGSLLGGLVFVFMISYRILCLPNPHCILQFWHAFNGSFGRIFNICLWLLKNTYKGRCYIVHRIDRCTVMQQYLLGTSCAFMLFPQRHTMSSLSRKLCPYRLWTIHYHIDKTWSGVCAGARHSHHMMNMMASSTGSHLLCIYCMKSVAGSTARPAQRLLQPSEANRSC